MNREQVNLLRCPRTSQPLTLESIVTDEPTGDVRFGFLSAEHYRYPIVEGIPVLHCDTAELNLLVEQGKYRMACVVAAFDHLDRSPSAGLLDGLADTRLFGSVARRLAIRSRSQFRGGMVDALYGDPPDRHPRADPLGLLHLDHRRRTTEGYHYFRYRFGLPRYIVSLSVIDGTRPPVGPVADIGCGSGHLAWAIAQRTSEPIVGVDPSFAQLLAARRMAPTVLFVCGDGRSIPLRSETFDLVVSSDVLPYVREKPTVAAEMVRVLVPDGTIVLTALRNSGCEHVYGGETLTPEGWMELTSRLAHSKLLGDDHIFTHYLEQRALGEAWSDDAADSQTLTIVASNVEPVLRTGQLATWPHAVGRLRPHPLLEPVDVVDGGVQFERRFPSTAFERDNARITDRLPKTCVIPYEILLNPDGAAGSDTEKLVADLVLLGQPTVTVAESAER